MKDKYLITHYLPLFAVMAATVIGFYLFSYDKNLKMALAIASVSAYFVWGLIHHHIHKDLSWSIAAEYLIISVFGAVAMLSLIN